MIEFITTPDLVIVNYIVFLISSIVYTIATIIVLTVSYPSAYNKLIYEISIADPEKMTFTELYFTGNILLVVSWMIFLGTLPMIIYPIWGLAIGYVTLESGLVYLFSIIFTLIVLYLFVVACFPHNLLKAFKSVGTSYCFNGCVSFYRLKSCCVTDGFWEQHLGKDHLVVMWFIFVISVFSVIGSLYYVAIDPTYATAWLWLVSSLTFSVGSYLYAIESYTGMGNSSIFFDYCCCVANGRHMKKASSQDAVEIDERMPLVR